MSEKKHKPMKKELKLLKKQVNQLKRQKMNNQTNMLKKQDVLGMLGVSPTNPIKNEIFKALPTYENKFSKQAIFKREDVLELIDSFPVANQDNPTTTA